MSIFTTIVVADIFSNFAQEHESVITYSELLRLLATQPPEAGLSLIPGQGMEVGLLYALQRQFEVLSLRVLEPTRYLPRAGNRQAHKQRPQNIVVSLARQLDRSNYEMDIHFDGSNEFFQDHMTGQHIQGMAIVEAMRQSFLSVTEQYHLNTSIHAYYFVIHDMSVRFERFLFPVDARLCYQIIKESIKDGRYGATVDIKVEQAGDACATGSVCFTAFDAAFIEGRERVAAKEVLVKHVNRLRSYGPDQLLERAPTQIAQSA
jgi:acyl-CoA thioesterase FadM